MKCKKALDCLYISILINCLGDICHFKLIRLEIVGSIISIPKEVSDLLISTELETVLLNKLRSLILILGEA